MECLQCHPSIILTIIQYLNIAEYISLRRTLPCFVRRPSAYPLPIDLLKGRLDGRTLFLCQQEGGGVYLTGGYLLGCLLGEKFEGSDIDLIVTESRETLYKDSFEVKNNIVYGYGDHNVAHYCLDDDNYFRILKKYKTREDTDEYLLHPNLSVFSRHLQYGINVLYFFEESKQIPNYISGFDFGFCKNVADFRRKKLIIGDLESVLKREYVLKKEDVLWRWTQTKVNFHEFSDRICERVGRYKNRGFDIKFEPLDQNKKDALFEILWNTIKRSFK